MPAQKELRFYKKIVTSCKDCPSLILDIDILICEKTLDIYTGSTNFMINCPLEDANFHLKNESVTNEEKRMLTAAFTANI